MSRASELLIERLQWEATIARKEIEFCNSSAYLTPRDKEYWEFELRSVEAELTRLHSELLTTAGE